MPKFRDKHLYLVDKIGRGLPNKFGLRQFDISIKTISYTGDRVSEGTPTSTTYNITVNQNAVNNNRPEVKLLKSGEIAASGGRYVFGDFRIGPVTPQYVKNGVTYGTLPSDIELTVNSNPEEVFFNMKGPGMSDSVNGDWFTLVETNFTKNFGYLFIIRKSGQVPA